MAKRWPVYAVICASCGFEASALDIERAKASLMDHFLAANHALPPAPPPEPAR